MKKANLKCAICLAIFSCAGSTNAGDYLGQLSTNPYAENSTSGIGSNNYRANQSINEGPIHFWRSKTI